MTAAQSRELAKSVSMEVKYDAAFAKIRYCAERGWFECYVEDAAELREYLMASGYAVTCIAGGMIKVSWW